ncbi:hypothetical protein [Sphingomonas sp.]|uniref:YunG family protein n=1 Tax=Sphingomonas sp. TaxID=28214 RepID=UPI001B039CD1|nr:hypothetical protein [Sphingomonas sp.]MBO9713173.1 hypothetical protein [Sphingomonas sp.]
MSVTLARLAAALEASWDAETAYLGAVRPGNPAYGQCYPTSRVVQHYFPELDVARGEVATGSGTECHFWNVRVTGDAVEHIDLSWQQFPPGSRRLAFELLDREPDDSPATTARCALLLARVRAVLPS